MISIAGRYLPIYNAAVAEYLEKYVNPKDVVEFDASGWVHSLHHLPGKGIDPFPKIKIGTYRHPSGASRFSVGYFLVDDDDLEAIYEDAFTDNGPAAVSLVMDTRDAVDDDATYTSIEAEVYCLPPRPLAQVAGANGLYLLTVVDERYWWWFESAVVENGASWSALYTNIGTALGVTITASSVSANYGVPSNRFKGIHQPIPMLFDAAAFYSGLRVSRHPMGTWVKAQSFTDATAVNNAEIAKISATDGPYYPLAGGVFDDFYTARNVPAGVQVVFGKTEDGAYSLTPHTVDVTLLGLVISQFGDSNGMAGAKKSLTGDLVAEFTGGSGTPDNVTALADYAEQLAEDWYKWQLGDLDQVLSGIVPWEPNGQIDVIEWTYRVGDCKTRIMRDRWYDHDWGRFRVNDNPGIFSSYPDELSPYENITVVEKVCPTFTEIDIPAFDSANETPTSGNTLVANGSTFNSVPISGISTLSSSGSLSYTASGIIEQQVFGS